MCVLKFIVQYRLNAMTYTFGLGYIFLVCDMAWVGFEYLSKTIEQLGEGEGYSFVTMALIAMIGVGVIGVNGRMIKRRKEMLRDLRG